ncbi:MAG: ABC transporter permease [Beutenbergiaceae bacterium]
MSAVTSVPRSPSIPSNARVWFWRVLQSEWVKLLAVRSTAWVLAVSVVIMVGFALLMAVGMVAIATSPPGTSGVDGGPDGSTVGLVVATVSYGVGQIVFAVLGAMRITGEYSTGQIRSTLTACPTRLPVLAAKAIVVAVTSFVTGLIATALSVLVTLPILSPHDMTIDLGDPEAQRVLLGVALYMVAVSLLSLGIGGMLRHTAGAIAATIGLLLVLPILSQIPLDFLGDIAPFFPSTAGERILSFGEGGLDPVLTPWQGYGVMLLWAFLALAGAAVLLHRRDA